MLRTHRAFTLIEVTIVVLLMGILTATVFLNSGIGASPDYKIREYARRVAGTMEIAKALASGSGAMVRIVYDFEEQRMFLMEPKKLEEGQSISEFDEERDLRPSNMFQIGDADDPERSDVWIDSVQSYDGRNYNDRRFTADVKAVGASVGHVVHLRSRNGEEFSIEMNPLTGLAYVYQYRKEPMKAERDWR